MQVACPVIKAMDTWNGHCADDPVPPGHNAPVSRMPDLNDLLASRPERQNFLHFSPNYQSYDFSGFLRE